MKDVLIPLIIPLIISFCVIASALLFGFGLSYAIEKGPQKGSYRTEVKGVGEWVCVYEVKKWGDEKVINCIPLTK